MTTSVSPEKNEESALSPKRQRYWQIGLAVGFVVVGLLVGWLGIQFATGRLSLVPHEFTGIVMQSPEPMNDFTLTSHTGEPFRLADLQGKTVAVYFGYTFCPDVCPATLAELVKAKQLLGDEGENLEVVMVSVDPGRDTPEKLAEYLAYFDPSFIGLTGSEEEILQVTTPFGVFYEKHEGTAASGYLVDHTASVMVLDDEGYLRLVFPFGIEGEGMAADLAYIMR
ncbi:MAG: SCO family protein [Anaerolineales bacterium]|nr:SCO family protein [Anaerolineales bacterium]